MMDIFSVLDSARLGQLLLHNKLVFYPLDYKDTVYSKLHHRDLHLKQNANVELRGGPQKIKTLS